MDKVIDVKEDYRDWREHLHRNSVSVAKKVMSGLSNHYPEYDPYNKYDKINDYYKWYYSKENDFGF